MLAEQVHMNNRVIPRGVVPNPPANVRHWSNHYQRKQNFAAHFNIPIPCKTFPYLIKTLDHGLPS